MSFFDNLAVGLSVVSNFEAILALIIWPYYLGAALT